MLLSDTDHDGNATTYSLEWRQPDDHSGQRPDDRGDLHLRPDHQGHLYDQRRHPRGRLHRGLRPPGDLLPRHRRSARQITYAYNAVPELTIITQKQLARVGHRGNRAVRLLAGQLVDVYYPDYYAPWSKADAYAAITYATDQATVTDHGTVNGTANQPMNTTTVTLGHESARPRAHPETIGGSGRHHLDLRPTPPTISSASATCTDGTQTATRSTNADNLAQRHRVTGSQQLPTRSKTYTYDSLHRLTSETDYSRAPAVLRPPPTATTRQRRPHRDPAGRCQQQRPVRHAKTATTAQGRTHLREQLISGTWQTAPGRDRLLELLRQRPAGHDDL